MNGDNGYKVVVVEDELPILENLVQKIKASSLPFTVAGQARDGESGLELIRSTQPHVLITDIHMPVMDGLRLVEKAVQLLPNLKILIVSGYDDFSYAQKALRFGVSDYLLKPVSSAKLHETLQRLHEELQQAGQRREREIVTSGLAGDVGQTNLPSSLGLRRYGMHLVVVGNLVVEDNSSLQKRISYYWDKVDIRAQVERILRADSGWWMVDEPSFNGKMLINVLPCASFGNLLYERLLEKSGGMFPVNVCSAVKEVKASRIWHTAQHLRTHLQKKLRPCHDMHMLAGGQLPADISVLSENTHKALTILSKSMNSEALSCSIHSLIADWKTAELTQMSLIQSCQNVLQILSEAHNCDPQWKSTLLQAENIIAGSVNEASLYNELQALFEHYITQNFQSNKTAQELFLRLRHYIDEHFREPITVGSISSDFHFSSSYITRVFKKHANQPPLRYLLELRINEAKTLIDQNPGLSFQTISEMVGFTDPHYFSRVFRSIAGMSPSAYRKKYDIIV